MIIDPYRTTEIPPSNTTAGISIVIDPYKESTTDIVLPEEEEEEVSDPLPEAGTYTENDIVENDKMFFTVENYMLNRYGLQAIEGRSRSKIVDDFLDERRGVAAGNTVRGLANVDFLNDIKNDEERRKIASEAAKLYENMAGIFSEEATWGETVRGTGDYIRSAVFDPINLIGGLVGKAVGGGSLRIASQTAQKQVLKEAAKNGSKKGVKDLKKLYSAALEQSTKESSKAVSEYTSKVFASKGFQRVKSQWVEIGAVTGIEASVSVGMELLYQEGLIDLGVREDYDSLAVAAAAAGSIFIGGFQAGKVALRGQSDIAVPSTALKEPNPEDLMSTFAQELGRFSESAVPKTDDWMKKVKGGQELEDLDTDFWISLIIGKKNEEGETIFKGLSEIALEKGFYWAQRADMEDTYSNWITDLVKQSSEDDIKLFIKNYKKLTGNQLKNADKLTVSQFGDTMARKINNAAQIQNATSQGAKQNGIALKDLEVKHTINDALDLGWVNPISESTTKTAKVFEAIPDSIRNNQNRVIRLLVANPSTSALNVIGWGANTTLTSVSDIAVATLHAGRGTMLKAIGMQKQGAKAHRIAAAIYKSNLNRVKLLLDPDMTYAAFESAMLRNSEALEKLASVLPGGVEKATNTLFKDKFSPSQKLVGLKVDDRIELIQKLTLVKAQDTFTKSQEFVFQMDKALRVATGKGWTDFYNWEDAYKVMATKEYRLLEAQAVEKTMEAIFSKSYKGKSITGEIAGVIEDARNIPGIGLLIPFGRFFNNTVDFSIQATPLSMAAKAMGKYSNKSYSELGAKSLVAMSLAYSLVDNERENRKKGLGLYQSEIGNEIITQKYDYPISGFKAAARLASYYMDGETPPKELLDQVKMDFTLAGLTRSLDRSQEDIGALVWHLFQGDMAESWEALGQATGRIGSQVVSGSTRFLEPLNVAAGVIRGPDGRPVDRKQGNKILNDSIRYIDNIIPLFLGESPREDLGLSTEVRKDAYGGEADVTSTKVFGIRANRLQNTQRVLNFLGLPEFNFGAATKFKNLAPEAANEYNGLLHDFIEVRAAKLMNPKSGFRKLNTETARKFWKDNVVKEAKEMAKSFLYIKNSGVSDTMDLQFELASTNKYSVQDLNEGLKELNFKVNFDELTRPQLFMLKEYLEFRDTLLELKIPSSVPASQY